MAEFKMTFDDGSTQVLVHHGVKGMKWGVRKERVSNGIKKRWTRDLSQYNPSARKSAAKKAAKTFGKGLAISAGGLAGIQLGTYVTEQVLTKKVGFLSMSKIVGSMPYRYGVQALSTAAVGFATDRAVKAVWQYNKDVYGNTGSKTMKRMRSNSLKSRRR